MQGKITQNAIKSSRRLVAKQKYVSPNQLTLPGFETPFEQALTTENRWVKLSSLIPWDSVVNLYNKQFYSTEGRPPINGRIVIGAVIIKHMLDLTDRETIMQIQENMFMQYFLGYSSFTNEAPFDASLFVDIRKRLSLEVTTAISELIIKYHIEEGSNGDSVKPGGGVNGSHSGSTTTENTAKEHNPNKGSLLMDATAAPQNITYPTDLKLLNAARVKSEEIIDKLYDKEKHGQLKPRTYRKLARKDFLNTNKKKRKSHHEIRIANDKQIRYLKRNLGHIETLLRAYDDNIDSAPLNKRLKEYYPVLQKVLEQQNHMHTNNLNAVENRIVSIHQAHVRPIVRGKEGKKVEFGSKIQLSLTRGFALVDKLDWNNFNEGTCLKESVEQYRKRFGYYPAKVLADKIYCTRENRSYLQNLNIELRAKPLGRPRKEAVQNHVSPGERNPIEGKIGQAKVGYGMDNIMAKLKVTSESWIGSIILVVNLIKLMRRLPLCLKLMFRWLNHIFTLPIYTYRVV